MSNHQSFGARAFTFDRSDPRWPTGLSALHDEPPRLRVVGELPFLDRAVAIVGTRRASPDAIASTELLARTLAEHGCVIVSGGAYGIDAAAHRGALAGNGLGVAVLASGLNRASPAAHRELFERIANNGALVSEVDDDVDPRAFTFLARNRLIAALAQVVIVVQAPIRSGALSTAHHAKRIDRALMAFPWALTDPRGEGCLELLARGGARACRGADDVLAFFGDAPRRTKRATTKRSAPSSQLELNVEQRSILNALESRPAYVDDLVRATGLTPARVQVTVTKLTVLGVVALDDRGVVRRVA